MASKKFHYYVLVMSNGGPKFVTKINYHNMTAEWDGEEKPLEMDKSRAEDLVIGITLNFNVAYMVCQPFEIDSQPYRYSDFDIEFVEKEKEEREDDAV